MRRAGGGVGLAVVLLLAWWAAGARAQDTMSLEELLERHVRARGGRAAWQQVQGMTITGTWEAFSEGVPMTIHRQRPGLYRFDHVLFGTPAVVGWDGSRAWIQSVAFGAPDGREITESWKRNIQEDALFASPLLDPEAAGATLELLGKETVEGTAAWAVRVTPDGRPPETWYLDAASFLELKRASRTFDVFSGGIEIEMETFFMDFRPAGGVMIPFREERHFGTRYHVYQADAVEVNSAVAPGLFQVPEARGAEEEAGEGAGG